MSHSRFTALAIGAVASLSLLTSMAHAQTITTSGSVHVGDNFYGLGYGQAGQVLWYTSASGTVSNTGGYQGYDPKSVGASVQIYPSYITLAETGQNTGYGGYGYANITQANDTATGSANPSPREAGLAGSNSVTTTGTGLSLITLTLGASVPSSLQIGILSDWGQQGDTPGSFVLSSGTSSATIADTYTIGGLSNNLYLFTLSDLKPNQVITLSGFGSAASTKTLYSGLTFDTVTSAPEPSSTAALSLGLLGLVGLAFTAKRRSAKQVS